MRPRHPAGWFPERGEIYFVPLDKLRPAIILSINSLNQSCLDVCVVPLTTVEKKSFQLRLEIPGGASGLRRRSIAKCDQVMTVSKEKLRFPAIGMVDDATLDRIARYVKVVLGIPD